MGDLRQRTTFPFSRHLRRLKHRLSSRPKKKRSFFLEQLEVRLALSFSAIWDEQGPGPMTGSSNSFAYPNSLAGAIETFAVRPSNPETIFAATVNGGIWRTDNANTPNQALITWTPQTDGLGSLAIGAIAFSPLDASGNTLFAGTGNFTNGGEPGGPAIGLLRTINGQDWVELDTSASDPLNGKRIRSVVPTKIPDSGTGGQVILVATVDGGGIYRSSDGGMTFGSVPVISGNATDLIADPNNDNAFYAAIAGTGVFRSIDNGVSFQPVSSTIPRIAGSLSIRLAAQDTGSDTILYAGVIDSTDRISGVFRDVQGGDNDDNNGSTTVDEVAEYNFVLIGRSGAITTATRTTAGGPVTIISALHGLATNDAVSIAGVVGLNDSNGYVKVTVVDANTFTIPTPTKTPPSPAGVGTGGTWTLVPDTGGQGTNDFTMAADPTDASKIYVAGVPSEPFRGDSTANTWTRVVSLPEPDPNNPGGPSIFSRPHPDHRELMFLNNTLLSANDGGLHQIPDPTNASTNKWVSLSGDMRAIESYRVGYDEISDRIQIGTQDNGSAAQSTIGGQNWTQYSGGDGAYQGVDNTGPNSVRYFFANNWTFFYRGVFGPTGNPIGSVATVAFAAPPTPANPTPAPMSGLTAADAGFRGFTPFPFAVNAVGANRLLLGGNGLYESFDQGNTITQYNLAGANSTNLKNVGAIAYGGRSAGVANPEVAWVGMDLDTTVPADGAMDVRLLLRTTAGNNFNPVTAYPGGKVLDIAVDPQDWRNVYIHDGSSVYMTTDQGATWRTILSVSGTSPFAAGDTILDVDAFRREAPAADLVMVSTESGVYVTATANLGFNPTAPAPALKPTWTKLGTQLPRVSVTDILYDVVDDILIAGTWGRGAWAIDQFSTEIKNSNILGTAFDDVDGDGVQDPNEPGQSGVVVKLFHSGNVIVGDADDVQIGIDQTTNEMGEFNFENVLAGSYFLQFTAPTGFAISPQDQPSGASNDDTKDSDADRPTGRTAIFVLDEDESITQYDVGVFGPDRFEENDTEATAKPIGVIPGLNLKNLSISTANDDDWFSVELLCADEDVKIEINSEAEFGNLDLSVYKVNPDGSSTFVDSSATSNDTESIIIDNALGSGTYRIHVYGRNPDTRNVYNLSANFVGTNARVFYVNDNSTTNDFYVEAPGNDANDGQDRAHPKATVQSILDTYDLEPHDIVLIDDGIYFEAVTLTGADEGACGFAGVPNGQSNFRSTWSLVDADFNTLYSLGFSLNGNAGVHLVPDNGSGSSHNTFRKNSFAFDGRGIWIEGGDSNIITDSNEFQFTTEAILLNGGQTTISNNQFHDLSNGVTASGSPTENADVVVANNTFENVVHGVTLGQYTNNADIHDNQFTGLSGHGVQTDSTADIHGNSFQSVFIGVALSTTSAASVHDNVIVDFDVGVDSDSGQSSVFDNRIRDGGLAIRGSGTFGGTDWSNGQPNDISGNTTGIHPYDGANIRFNLIHDNSRGIVVEHSMVTVHNNLIYRNETSGILAQNNGVTVAQFLDITNNTFYLESTPNTSGADPSNYGVRLRDGAHDVHLKNNIFWASGDDAYDIHVANDSQQGFSSDYNNLFATNNGTLVHWQKPFLDLFDWQVEADFDSHSIGRTNLAPTLDNPQFVDLPNNDFHLSGFGSATMSTSIDAGDVGSVFTLEPSPNGGRIDIGAYGNTAQSSASKPAYIEIAYPNYYTDYEMESGRAIEWKTFNVTGSVKIELFEEGVGKIDDIATVDASQGVYGWNPAASGVTGSINRRFSVLISSIDLPNVVRQSRESFSVPPAGSEYFVDDASNASDEITPSAMGNNRSTGKSTGDPKANLLPVLRAYDLRPGDIVHFDTGDYMNVRNVVLSGSPGIGDDEGITLVGPTSAANVARLDRGNPNVGATNIELNDADFVTLQRLTLVGAERGLWIHSQSTQFTGTDLIVSENSGPGILVESDATGSTFARLTAADNGGDGISIAAPIASLVDSIARDNDGTGIRLQNQLSTVVSGNQAFGNDIHGIDASGGISNFSNNVAHDNDQIGLSVSTGLTATIEKNESFGNNVGMAVSANSGNFTVLGNTDLTLQRGNKIHDNSTLGVDASGTVIVAGNTISGQVLGTGLMLGGNAQALHNVVSNNLYGISGVIGSTGQIVGNRVFDGNEGIRAYSDTDIRENVVYSTSYGIIASAFFYGGLAPYTGQITNNLVYDNFVRGVIVDTGGTGMLFANNTVYETDGSGAVRIQATVGSTSNDINLRNNILWVKSGYAISVDSNSQSGFSSDFNILRGTDFGVVGIWQDVIRTDLNAWRNASFTDENSTSANPLFVDADGTDGIVGFVAGGSDGRDDDFHEQSMFGSFHGGSLAPVVDATSGLPLLPTTSLSLDSQQSPAVDRGDSSSDFSNEPIPNGGYVNLGTYGNTNQASKSPVEYVLVTQPDGGEIWPQEQTFTIKWRSHNLNDAVDIQLVSSDGTTTVANIATGTANDGEFVWNIPSPDTDPAATFSPGTYKVAVQRGVLTDTSNDPFQIVGPIHTYYVNDDSTVNDVFTTAPGDDGNSGLFPFAPKASVRAVLEAYDLGPNDVIRVDTGYYTLSTDIVITDNDSGVTIEGPDVAQLPLYRTAVMDSAPLGYWRLGETSGTTAVDSSGNGLDGTYSGSPTLGQEGVTRTDQNTSVEFDGIDDQVDFGSGLQLSGIALTLEGWVYLDPSISATDHEIISRVRPEVPADINNPFQPEIRQYRLFVGANRGLGFGIATSANGTDFSQPEVQFGTIPLGVFTHVAATFDGTKMRVFMNGSEVGSIDHTGTMPPISGFAAIGSFLGTKNFFDGRLDEVAIYDRVLSPTEIREHNTVGQSLYGAILDRQNPAIGNDVFELNNADNITLNHLAMVGADYGVSANTDSDSDFLTITHSTVFGNARSGVNMAEHNDNVSILSSELFGLRFNTTEDDQARNIDLRGLDSLVSNSEVHHGSDIGIYVEHGVVQSSTSHDNAYYGIYLSDGVAETNIAFNNSADGIGLGPNAVASGNTVHDNGTGIAADAINIVVQDNTAFDNNIGIHTGYSATAVQVTGNTAYRNRDAGIFIQSTDGVAMNNVAYDNVDGIRAGIQVAGMRVEKNRAYHNSSAGIRGYNNTRIANNIAYNNATGVHADSYVIYGGLIHFYGSVENNLSYDNSIAGITVDGNTVEVLQNTVYQPAGNALVVETSDFYNVGSVNIRLRNNVLQVNAGYGLRVSAESQVGFDSDYNLIHATGTGKFGLWQGVEFTRQEDWFYDVGQDMHSFSADPQFDNPAGPDGLLGYANDADHGTDDDFDFVATSPVIDQGDPLSYYLTEPEPNGNRANLGHHGNTTSSNPSAAQTLQILSPNGLEKLEIGQETKIQWHTSGYTNVDAVALMNVGGPTVDNWLANRFSEGPIGFGMTDRDIEIDGISDPAPEAVYQSFAAGNYGEGSKLRYSLAVPTGDYTLRLHFAEPADFFGAGYRVFDIMVGGSTVRSDYDIFAEAGAAFRAVALSLPVTATNGSLVLDLVNKTGYPAILSGIELTRTTPTPNVPSFDLALSTTNGGPTTPIVADQTIDRFGRGSFTWTVSGPETLDARVHVTDGQSNSSDKTFVIANAGADYYVDDASNTTDIFTPTAMGDNANSGKSPDSPMATLAALIDAYDLDLGDVVHVDSGSYQLVRNTVLTSQDAGVRILGSTTIRPTLDRGNVAPGSNVIELQFVTDVKLDRLGLTGGVIGIYAPFAEANVLTGSDRIEISENLIFANKDNGILFEAGNDLTSVRLSELFGVPGGETDDNQPFAIVLRGLDSIVTLNTISASGDPAQDGTGAGIQIKKGTVSDNTISTSSRGIESQGGVIEGNTVHDSNVGIFADGYLNSVSISANQTRDNRIGISAGNNVVIDGNTSNDNSEAGIIFSGTGPIVSNNRVSGNVDGIVGQPFSYGAVVRDNSAVHNSSRGILVYGNTFVSNNKAYSNSIGIMGSYYFGPSRYAGEISNNLVYSNTNEGIVVTGDGAQILNNTVVQPIGDAVRIDPESIGSTNIHLRNNILQAGVGYLINVAPSGQNGFDSDYNLLFTTGSAKVALWQNQESETLADWFYDVGFDRHSNQANPGFVDPDGVDNKLGYTDDDHGADDDFSVIATSPTIDAGDLQSYYLAEPFPNGGRANLGHTGNNFNATKSTDHVVQVLSPNGLEKLESGHTTSIEWRANGFQAIEYAALINVGGSTVDNWLVDRYRTSVALPDSITELVNLTGVTDPAPQDVYQKYGSAEYDSGNKLTYALPVANGTYNIRLHFVEPYAFSDRQFDIRLQGATVQAGFDITVAAGDFRKATTVTFPVTAEDDGIQLELVNVSRMPAVLSAIELTRANPSGTASPTFDLDLTTVDGGGLLGIVLDQGVDRFGIGSYPWVIGGETNMARVHVTSESPTVTDASDNTFIIANAGRDYYVDDGSDTGDEFTPNAIGDNRNSGKSATSPMQSVQGLLAAYDLEPGDVIHVDTGNYTVVRNIVLEADDNGVRIEGPHSPAVAVLDRANPTAGSYVFDLQAADNIGLDRLSITGGQIGVYAGFNANSDGFTLSNSQVFANAMAGVQFEQGNDNATIRNNMIFGSPNGIPTDDQLLGVLLAGLNSSVVGNTVHDSHWTGIAVHDGSVAGNTVYNDHAGSQGIAIDTGMVSANTVYGIAGNAIVGNNEVTLSGNTARDSQNGFVIGFDSVAEGNMAFDNSDTGIVSGGGKVLNNVVFGNVTGIRGYGNVDSNRVFNNTGIGIQAQFDAQVLNNTVYSNSIGIVGEIAYFSYPFTGNVINNRIYANANQGLIMHAAGSRVENNTIYQPVGEAVRAEMNSANLTLKNNILWVDAGNDIFLTSDSQSGFVSDFNLLFKGPSPDAKVAFFNNVDVDTLSEWQAVSGQDANGLNDAPQFVDVNGADNVFGYSAAGNGFDGGYDDNFHFVRLSLAIDRGDATSAPATDREGSSRIDDPGTTNFLGSIVDLGSDEFQGSSLDINPPTMLEAAIHAHSSSLGPYSEIHVAFSEAVDHTDALAPANYELRAAGPNNTFDDSDDIVYALVPAHGRGSSEVVIRVIVPGGGALPTGNYRFLVSGNSTIHDLAGNRLDGDDDGQQGGNSISVNHSPTLHDISKPPAVNEGGTVSFIVSGEDTDAGESLKFHLDADAPAGATINESTGAFSWTTSEANGAGVYTISVTVSDTGAPSLSDLKTFIVTVNEVNSAPVLTAIGDKVASVGNLFTFVAVASDSDLPAGTPASTLTYSLGAGAPFGSAIDPVSGVFTWVPNATFLGQQVDVTVLVKDAGSPSLEDSETITITVNDSNSPPSTINLSNSSLKEKLSGAIIGTLSAVDSDADQTHTFSVTDSRFEIVGTTLKLKSDQYLTSPPTSIDLEVTATDTGSPPQSLTKTLTIDVIANGTPWQYAILQFDSNGDGFVVPQDVLRVINQLNIPTILEPDGKLPLSRPADSELPYYDINGDGYCTPNDVLRIINYLILTGGESESSASVDLHAEQYLVLNIVSPPSVSIELDSNREELVDSAWSVPQFEAAPFVERDQLEAAPDILDDSSDEMESILDEIAGGVLEGLNSDRP